MNLSWLENSQLALDYNRNEPYPHLLIRDALPPEIALSIAREFPKPDSHWRSYHHFNERKWGLEKQERFPKVAQQLVRELQSQPFLDSLSAITGIKNLLADPDLCGGGLQCTPRGGFLNIHTDCSAHHYRSLWRRRLNLILYLNERWDERWGGELELWNRTMTQKVRHYPPLLNHMVIFSCSEFSYHGHPNPISCPDDTYRKSLALYYFTDEKKPVPLHSTRYRSTPSDGIMRRAFMSLDNLLLSIYTLARRILSIL